MPVSPSAIEHVFFTPTTPRRWVIATTFSRPTCSDTLTAGTLSDMRKASMAASERPELPPE